MPEQHPDREALKDRIVGRFDSADKGIHGRLRKRWDDFDRDYHNYRDLSASVVGASENDRDTVVDSGRKMFGHELFIPMTFATVESTLAQLMANPPHPVVLPARKSTSPQAAMNMGYLIADQQDRISVELRFQSAGKSALKFGLGVVKSRWQRTMVDVQRVVRSAAPGGGYALAEVNEAVFDGPKAEAVDIRDFLWDPMAHDVETARWLIHRLWPDTDSVLERFKSGAWTVEDASGEMVPLSADDVNSGSGKNEYATLRAGELQAQGMANSLDPSRLGDIHELWEYHDGKRVVYVLDRRWIVQEFANSTPKTRMPFHIYRPTEIEHCFHGKGVIEPTRDLQAELNDLRTDRRWNALMALHQFFFYDENALDSDNAVIFPGAMIPTRGNPNDLIKQGNVKDIPGSGYQEEEALKSDYYMTIGQTDPADQSSAPETATGVQLVQASQKHRINGMVRRAERELAVPVGRHWVELNQREILAARSVRRPVAAPDPTQPDRLFEVVELSPEDLMGELDYNIVGNSLAADNVAQQRQDAQTLMQLLSMPQFASDPLAQEVLVKMGYPNPQAYLAPKAPPVPAGFVDKVKSAMGEEAANALLAAAQQEAENGG